MTMKMRALQPSADCSGLHKKTNAFFYNPGKFPRGLFFLLSFSSPTRVFAWTTTTNKHICMDHSLLSVFSRVLLLGSLQAAGAGVHAGHDVGALAGREHVLEGLHAPALRQLEGAVVVAHHLAVHVALVHPCCRRRRRLSPCVEVGVGGDMDGVWGVCRGEGCPSQPDTAYTHRLHVAGRNHLGLDVQLLEVLLPHNHPLVHDAHPPPVLPLAVRPGLAPAACVVPTADALLGPPLCGDQTSFKGGVKPHHRLRKVRPVQSRPQRNHDGRLRPLRLTTM